MDPSSSDTTGLSPIDITHTLEALYPFPEKVIIQDRQSAAQYARHILDIQGSMERHLVMWADASVQLHPRARRSKRISAAAVAYVDFSSQEWKDCLAINTVQYERQPVLEAEFVAIQEAFRIACRLNDSFDHLLIFSDNQTILRGLSAQARFHFLPRQEMRDNMFMYANWLYDLGIIVELRWVPAHSSIKGNERVDKLAKGVRRYAETLLAQTLPDAVLKDVIISSSSTKEIQRTLVSQINQPRPSNKNNRDNSENNGSKKRANADVVDGDEAPRKKRRTETILVEEWKEFMTKAGSNAETTPRESDTLTSLSFPREAIEPGG